MGTNHYASVKRRWERYFKEVGDLFGDDEEAKARERECSKMAGELKKAKLADEEPARRLQDRKALQQRRIEHIEYERRRIVAEQEKVRKENAQRLQAIISAEHQGLLLTVACSRCSEAAWVPELLPDSRCRSICDECGNTITADKDQTIAVNLGLLPDACDKCHEEDWLFDSLSKNQVASKWTCKFCGKKRIVTAVRSGNDQTKREAISTSVKNAVWRRDQGMCVQCGSKENLEFDHIIPFSKGGSNTARNLQLLCEPCNRSKSAKIQ